VTAIIILSPKGKGKTTFLLAFAHHAVRCGKIVGGIASPAVFDGGSRIGYDLLDLRTGRRGVLARMVNNDRIEPTVGMYRFDEEAISWGNAAVVSALRTGTEVIAIDEIGPLEFKGGGWAPAVEIALGECVPDQQLVVTVRPALVDGLPERFPSPIWETARRVSPPWPPLPLE